MQPQFADELLKPRRSLRLPRNVLENVGIGEHRRELSAISRQLSAYRTRWKWIPICSVILSEAKDLCTLRPVARVLRPANDVGLRMTHQCFLPTIATPARRPRPQRAPNHRNLPHVIAVVGHHLPQHSLQRSGDRPVPFVNAFDFTLKFWCR